MTTRHVSALNSVVHADLRAKLIAAQGERDAVEAEALKHPASFPRVLTTSAEKPLGPIGGITELRDAVARVLLGLGDDFGDMFA